MIEFFGLAPSADTVESVVLFGTVLFDFVDFVEDETEAGGERGWSGGRWRRWRRTGEISGEK